MQTNPIYQHYSGKKISDKVTVFKNGENYNFLYQKFKRSNPSQSERQVGFKPKRILISEESYTLSNLNTVDFKQYPFSHLLDQFFIQENLTWSG